eukprot:jgi/Orpsp1_1/1178130/evm.model.c7180000064165.1
MASFLGNRFGRKKTIMLSAYVFVLGSVIQCFTVHSWIIFCFGKLISGFSIGCISTLCPIYIAEIVPAKRRGKYISYNTLMSCFGSLIGTIITCIIWYYTNVNPKDLGIPRAKVDEPINNFEWRFSFLLQVILGIIVAICLKFLPCSPRWLCLKDRDEEALKVLSKLNGCSSTDDVAVQTELRSIQEEATSSRSTGIGQLFGSVLRRRTFSTILMRLFQQFNGINIILYIQSHIFAEIGFTPFFSKFIEPIFFAIVTLISILPGMWTIDRLGRKNLLTIGSILMIFLHLISWYLYSKSSSGVVYKYYAVGAVLLFLIIYNSTWGLVPETYQSEVFPLRVRIKGAAVGNLSSLVGGFIISILGPALMMRYGTKILIFFAIICLIISVISKLFFIESKGYTLEEMDEKMSGKKYDKMESTV